MAEFDIELGRLEQALGLGFRGLCCLQGLAALVDDLFGDGTGLDQVQAAVEFALGEFRLGARIRELTVRLLGDGFEGTGIDDIQKVAGPDESAVAKLDVGDEATDAGANLNLFNRLEPAGEFIPIRHGALGGLGHRDGRRSSRGLWRRLVPAARQGDGKQNDQRPEIAK